MTRAEPDLLDLTAVSGEQLQQLVAQAEADLDRREELLQKLLEGTRQTEQELKKLRNPQGDWD